MTEIENLSPNQSLAVELATAFGAVFPELAGAWFPGMSRNAVLKLFKRLARAGLLRKYSWAGVQPYFVLGRRAVRLLDLPPRRVEPLGPTGLVQHAGVMGACVAADLDKLTAARFVAEFPDLVARGLQASYYALTAEDTLAWVVVDHGASGFGLAKKLQKAVAQRYRVPAFRDLLHGGAFSLVLAAATPAKAAEVEEALAKDPVRHAAVRVVVPILARLLLTDGGSR
jgi:hypothetical protein